MRYRAFKYIAKVWVTSALITPIIAVPVYFALRQMIDISDGLPKKPAMSFWLSYFYLLSMVIIGSFLPWLISLTFARSVINSSLNTLVKKLILGAVPVILFAAILLVGGSGQHFKAWQSAFEGWLGYTIAVALSLWFYNINTKTSIVEQKGASAIIGN